MPRCRPSPTPSRPPRPYSRHNLVQGTKGTLASFPNRLAIEGVNNYHGWAEGDAFEKITAQYEHPLVKRMGELAAAMDDSKKVMGFTTHNPNNAFARPLARKKLGM